MLNEIIEKVTNWYNGQTNWGESSPNLTITASDNEITIWYNRDAEDFKEYLNKIDDDLFIDVCEKLGNDKLHELANNINTKEVIKEFKQALKDTIETKLNYYQECWNNLIR